MMLFCNELGGPSESECAKLTDVMEVTRKETFFKQ